MDFEKIMFGGAIAATVIFVILSTTGNTDLIENESWAIEETCLGSHSTDISHTHSYLTIVVNGTEQYIPNNVGIADSELSLIHISEPTRPERSRMPSSA